MFCTFVGQMYKRKQPLEKKHELCRAVTLTEYDKTALEALCLKENGQLLTFKDTVQLAEEYTNGGIEYLLEDFLRDFTYQDDDGTWHIKPGTHDQIQMELMDFVIREKETVPF